MKMNLRKVIAGIAILGASNAVFAQGYHVINTFHIASSGGWDYIATCPVNDNIYVSHGTQVNILNKNTGDSVGVILNTEGVHGIAFAPEFNKGFTSNGKTNDLTVFDIKTNAIIRKITVGEKPDAIMYDPFTKKIIVCNGKSKDATVIDPDANEIVKTIALGGKPETAVSDLAGKIYINIEDKSEILVVDTKTWTVTKHWKTGKGEEPTGLAIDIKTKRLFAGCNKLMVIMNAENGKVVKELPIGEGCDGTAFDPGTKTAFSSNGDGTMTVVKENSANDFKVVENAKTKKGARTLVLDEKTHKIYMPAAEIGAPVEGQKRPSMVPGTFQVLEIGK